jgi:hypothetical protein
MAFSADGERASLRQHQSNVPHDQSCQDAEKAQANSQEQASVLHYPVAFTALKETHCRPASAQAVKIFIRKRRSRGPTARTAQGWSLFFFHRDRNRPDGRKPDFVAFHLSD